MRRFFASILAPTLLALGACAGLPDPMSLIPFVLDATPTPPPTPTFTPASERRRTASKRRCTEGAEGSIFFAISSEANGMLIETEADAQRSRRCKTAWLSGQPAASTQVV